jgi:hypothetical protein
MRNRHGHVLFFAASVGEAEVNEFDFAFFHHFHDVGDGLCHQDLLGVGLAFGTMNGGLGCRFYAIGLRTKTWPHYAQVLAAAR